MSDFNNDFNSDFGPANRVPYQTQLRYNVPITSPVGTIVLVGTSPVPVIADNAVRRGIVFFNPGSVVIYVVPSNQGAVIGFGNPIFPGDGFEIFNDPDSNVACTSGWNAIAASGSSNPLTVLELL